MSTIHESVFRGKSTHKGSKKEVQERTAKTGRCCIGSNAERDGVD